jgi:ubiquinone/menaquinone biosynthesis C-methylase UbiE
LFCCASAHALPFRNDTFDFIVARAVINYTHQKIALNEALRVLRPSACMFLRVESINWDFRAVTHPTGGLRYLFNLRSLGVGLMHDATGYQTMPGGWLRGPRAYVSERRLHQMVKAAGGEILRYEPSRRGPQFLGRGTQDVVLCRKLDGV